MDSEQFDFVVIGGGPGGYVAAIRAAQLGLKTACIEKESTLGGTCLNVGCIPSKALLDSTELLSQIQTKAARHGIKVAGVEVDIETMMARKSQVVSGLTRGIEGLFRKNGVEWIRGAARLAGGGEAQVGGAGGADRRVWAKHLVIATGSAPAVLPGAPFDEERILSSTGALSLPSPPEHLIVIGGGVIGLELGSVWLRLGSKVTILEWASSILPGMDTEIARAAASAFRKQGFDLRTGSRVTRVEKGDSGVRVLLEGSEPVEGDRLLVAVGRTPYTAGLCTEQVGIRQDARGALVVDNGYRAAPDGLYAIGDVIGGAMLAHKAMEEGAAVAEIAAGKAGIVDYDAVPIVVYSSPEVASVGKTESALREEGREIIVGKFPFMASGRARAMDEAEGFVKVIGDAKTHRLLAVHIAGPRASDIITEAAVAIEFQASVDDLAVCVHAHPTLPEAIKEAALGALGREIHA